jgi:proteic killer suppression protein
VARRYIERVNILYQAKSVDDLFKIPPLKFHPLKGDRKGQHAMTLHDRTRMIVSLRKKKVKGSKTRTTVIRVEEVSEHYGD